MADDLHGANSDPLNELLSSRTQVALKLKGNKDWPRYRTAAAPLQDQGERHKLWEYGTACCADLSASSRMFAVVTHIYARLLCGRLLTELVL